MFLSQVEHKFNYALLIDSYNHSYDEVTMIVIYVYSFVYLICYCDDVIPIWIIFYNLCCGMNEI